MNKPYWNYWWNRPYIRNGKMPVFYNMFDIWKEIETNKLNSNFHTCTLSRRLVLFIARKGPLIFGWYFVNISGNIHVQIIRWREAYVNPS